MDNMISSPMEAADEMMVISLMAGARNGIYLDNISGLRLVIGKGETPDFDYDRREPARPGEPPVSEVLRFRYGGESYDYDMNRKDRFCRNTDTGLEPVPEEVFGRLLAKYVASARKEWL